MCNKLDSVTLIDALKKLGLGYNDTGFISCIYNEEHGDNGFAVDEGYYTSDKKLVWLHECSICHNYTVICTDSDHELEDKKFCEHIESHNLPNGIVIKLRQYLEEEKVVFYVQSFYKEDSFEYDEFVVYEDAHDYFLKSIDEYKDYTQEDIDKYIYVH